MRGPILPALAVLAALAALAPAAQAHPVDMTGESLRRDWYRCVRQHFSGQPPSVEKSAAQRAALAACRAQEDAYVAAELAARLGGEAEGGRERAGPAPGLTGRARAFMASVASTIVDPLAAWFGLGR